MRILLLATILVTACGTSSESGDGGNNDIAVGDAASLADLTTPADAFLCGNVLCGAGTVCCVTGTSPACAASCSGDGGFVASCRGPENCSGNPCCITIGSGFSVHDVMCGTAPTSCPPNINATSGMGQDRACHVDADCTGGATGTNLPDCCTSTATGQHVCFNSGLVSVVSGFTCP